MKYLFLWMNVLVLLLGCSQQIRKPSGNGYSGAVICPGRNCLAAGAYQGLTGEIFPLLVQSKDGGKTYGNSVSIPLPADANDSFIVAGLSSITCRNQMCLAAGVYFNQFTSLAPFIVRSINGGKTFTLVSLSLPSGYNSVSDTVFLFGITCENQNCVAVGSYLNASGQFPFALYSHDEGQTFESSLFTQLPKDFDPTIEMTYLAGITCQNHNCEASGIYSNTLGGSTPMMVRSTNGGKTFDAVVSLLLPDDIDLDMNQVDQVSVLPVVRCFSQICITGGGYSNISGGATPFALISIDNGKNFLYPSVIQLPEGSDSSLSINNQSPVIFDITCLYRICRGVGAYTTTMGGSLPLSLISTDNGETFADSSLSLPQDLVTTGSNTALAGIACTESGCSAVGVYDSFQGIAPLAMHSPSAVSGLVPAVVSLPSNAILENMECAGFGMPGLLTVLQCLDL